MKINKKKTMKKSRFILFIFLFLSLTTSKVFSQEIKFKAIFIYNFTKHFEWPPNAKTGDFVIGVVGKSQLYDKLSQMTTGKKAGNQPIVVKKFRSTKELTQCHILFISEFNSGTNSMKTALAKIGNFPTLIVTEKEGMAYKNAAINFVIKDQKMQFEMNTSNIAKCGLKVSKYLQNLAIIVK
ncbi:MAG: YfiR family protein [Bacteroidetes bacterium]|nr:MAG: YfiR family protein [Bacteroidota bacterium]